MKEIVLDACAEGSEVIVDSFDKSFIYLFKHIFFHVEPFMGSTFKGSRLGTYHW